VAQVSGVQDLDELHTKNNHDGKVCKCWCIKNSLTNFSLFCCLFFVFFQTKSHPFFGDLLAFFQDKQVCLIVVFKKYFSLVHQSQQWQLTEKLIFSYPFCLHSFI